MHLGGEERLAALLDFISGDAAPPVADGNADVRAVGLLGAHDELSVGRGVAATQSNFTPTQLTAAVCVSAIV